MCGGERHIKPLAFGRGTIFLSVRQIFISLNAFNNYASYYFRKLNARLFSRADQLPEHRWECILILQKRLCARRMVLVSRRTRSSRNNDPPWMHNPSWSSHGGMSIPYIYHLMLIIRLPSGNSCLSSATNSFFSTASMATLSLSWS
jgi:hypothetical protein